MTKVHDEASKVAAEGGFILVNGPDGVAVALTPEAAADTSDRLLEGATLAAGQRRAAVQDRERRECGRS